MNMPKEDFEKLLDNYVEGEDVMITNARGFWEKAPKMKALILNKGLHILLKNKDLIELLNKIKPVYTKKDVYKLCEEFCNTKNLSCSELIADILETKFQVISRLDYI